MGLPGAALLKKPKRAIAQPTAPKPKGPGGCFTWDGDTLVLNILGKPSAKADAIGKVMGHQLKVSVTAAPVGGRATDHMVRFLAGEFGVTAKDIEVVSGRMNVNKQLRIKAPKKLPSVLAKALP
jgi:hypothetical protein